jgi:hypothetical protein
VVDLKGQKRFKPHKFASQGEGPSLDELDIHTLDVNTAKKIFKKQNTKTAYCWQFGERPKAAEDFMIVKQKPLSELPISSPLKPEITSILEKWIGINDQDEFTRRIFFTLREMFTIVKAQFAPNTTTGDLFLKKKSYVGSLPPRFDIMERVIKDEERVRNTIRADLLRTQLGSRVATPHRTTMPYFDPLIDPKSFK